MDCKEEEMRRGGGSRRRGKIAGVSRRRMVIGSQEDMFSVQALHTRGLLQVV
jgi:hypothetical protein